jgi:hypothetical protein
LQWFAFALADKLRCVFGNSVYRLIGLCRLAKKWRFKSPKLRLQNALRGLLFVRFESKQLPTKFGLGQKLDCNEWFTLLNNPAK